MPGRASFADALSRFVFEGAAVRGALVSLDDTCRDILACHPYPPALARALAELLAASALLASTLKFRGALVVQLQGAGPVRLLVVECDADLNLRATAQWNREADILAAGAPLTVLAGEAARSRLSITLDPKDGGPVSQGVVALDATSIATLIEHYLTTSEQIDSRMLLASDEGRIRGLLMQRLPGATATDDVTWTRASAEFARIGDDELLAAGSVETLLAGIFPDDDLRLFASRAVRYRCNCSLERVASVLRMLGRAEVETILAEQGLIGVTCEFCNRPYTFVADEARALFQGRGAADGAPREGLKH